jgi:PAS domain S-box-containing protein
MAVEAADLGIWEWFDPPHGLRRWSGRCRELFGLRADDNADITEERVLGAIHPDDRERWSAVVREALDPKRGDGVYRIEYRIIGISDGVERWISATGRTLFEGDRPVRMLGTMEDATERKRAEQDRDIFLRILRHDLRSPLSAILMSAERLLRKKDPETAPSAARIASSTKRMGRMIDDLLDFARARAGSFELHPAPLELCVLCRELLDELGPANQGRTLTLECPGEVQGEWDSDRLQQVVQNLVVNALVHGRPDTPVKVVVHGGEGVAVIDVINEGDPVPAAVREQLFNPFRPREMRGQGLGLGLYIASAIVSALGGSIAVCSDAGTTRFSVTVPLHASAPSAP